MQVQTILNTKNHILWVLVADGEHAQIYRYHKNDNEVSLSGKNDQSAFHNKSKHELALVPGMDIKASASNIYDLHHHDQGNFVGGMSAAHNTSEPRFDVHDEIKLGLVMAIVKKLKHASLNEFFHQLIIVAPPRVLSAIKQHLHTTVLARIIAEVPKDYTHDIHDGLLKHLQLTFDDKHIE